MCKGKIAGVQVCIIANFWCAGVHQTIVVKIWESYCTFCECFVCKVYLQPIFLLLKIFKNFEYKTSKHGIGRGVQSKSRGHVFNKISGGGGVFQYGKKRVCTAHVPCTESLASIVFYCFLLFLGAQVQCTEI